MLIRGDALHLPLEDDVVQTVVTSPPYLRQRVYGDSPHEGGREETLEQYVTWLGDVFDEVRRVLHPSGHAWLNIGDKANGSGGAGGDWSRKRDDPDLAARQQRSRGPGKFLDPAYEEASYLDVPGAVVAELLRRGWRLRLPIVWDKGRDAPESLDHVKRPRFRHEMVFLLSPSRRATRKPRHAVRKPRFYPSQLAETGSIWHFPPGGSGPAHLAPFPDELARRCILPTTLPGDLVLDPFDGSGTTRRVAESLGRRAVGIDLYAGLDVDELVPGPPRARRHVDAAVLKELDFGLGAFYFAARRIAGGEDLDAVALDLKLTPPQTLYLDELTTPDPQPREEASA